MKGDGMSILLDSALQQPLEIGRDVYPQPVATACGYILRARSPEHLLEVTLKAAEVLARYLGALALTSYACRQSEPPAPAFQPDRFLKPLAFGDFRTHSVRGDLRLRSPAATPVRGNGRQEQETGQSGSHDGRRLGQATDFPQ